CCCEPRAVSWTRSPQILIDSVEKGHAESPIILETLARAYLQHLKFMPAYACLTRWIEDAPDSAKPYYLRAWAQERLNHPKLALEDYLHALDRDPELTTVLLRVAE